MIIPSLMTIPMFVRFLYKYKIDHDIDDLAEGYDEMLDLVSDTGFSAVDITAWELSYLGIDRVRSALERYHLKVSSYIYPDTFALADEEGSAKRVENAKSAADNAVSLGCDVLMLVPQAHEGIDTISPEWIRSQLIRHWIPVTEYARSKGLKVVIEDTPDLKLHLCRADDVSEVLDAVPGLELVYDSGNMILAGEDPLEYLKRFQKRIGYVHLKDMREAPEGAIRYDLSEDGVRMSSAPTGTGSVDLKKITDHLKQTGYDGYLTVEFCVDDDNDFRRSLIRTYEYVQNELLEYIGGSES